MAVTVYDINSEPQSPQVHALNESHGIINHCQPYNLIAGRQGMSCHDDMTKLWLLIN